MLPSYISENVLPQLRKPHLKEIYAALDELNKNYTKVFSTQCKINFAKLKKYLKHHPKADQLFLLISKGFHIGVPDDVDRNSFSKKVKNIIITFADLLEMLTRLNKELLAGYIVPGVGAYQLNLLCVPKKDGDTGLMTKIRVARHASFSEPGKQALNETIPDEEKQMIGDLALPKFLEYLIFFLRNDFVSLRDLKDAFRQILLAEEDRGLVQYCIFGLSFVDLRQVYGVASASNRCQHFSNTLKWIVANTSEHFQRDGLVSIEDIIAYIDDFTIGAPGPTSALCSARSRAFDKRVGDLNVDLSHGKSEDNLRVGVTNGIGFRLNVCPKTVFIPKFKALDLIVGCLAVIRHHWIIADALEMLVGRILHWARFEPRARIACNYALHQIQQHLRCWSTAKKKAIVFRVDFRLRKSLEMYLRFFERFREVPIVKILFRPRPSIMACTDASNQGGGFMCGNFFCAYDFAAEPNSSGVCHATMRIELREAHAVLMLLHILGSKLIGRKLLLFVDNKAVVAGVKKSWSKSGRLVEWMEEITLLAMHLSCDIDVRYIPTRYNLPADELSRGPAGRAKFEELSELFGWSNMTEIVVPNARHPLYYEDMRLMHAPIKMPQWDHLVSSKENRLIHPALLKLWRQFDPQTL